MLNSVSVGHLCREKYSGRSFIDGNYHFIGWEVFIFCDVTKSNFLSQKSNLWYHKNEFVISKNQGYFVISENLFFDIIKSNLWYHKIDFFDITKSRRFGDITKLILSQNRFFEITKLRRFCDITHLILWYHKFDFFISKNRFFDIKKKKIRVILWYQKIYFVISKNRISDIKKKRICDIKKSILWYHKKGVL